MPASITIVGLYFISDCCFRLSLLLVKPLIIPARVLDSVTLPLKKIHFSWENHSHLIPVMSKQFTAGSYHSTNQHAKCRMHLMLVKSKIYQLFIQFQVTQ